MTRERSLLAHINHMLVMALRETVGREAGPTAGGIDNQSVKITELIHGGDESSANRFLYRRYGLKLSVKFFTLDSPMIYEQCANSHRRDFEVFRHLLLIFHRIIAL
jgi:hypothetical protein